MTTKAVTIDGLTLHCNTGKKYMVLARTTNDGPAGMFRGFGTVKRTDSLDVAEKAYKALDPEGRPAYVAGVIVDTKQGIIVLGRDDVREFDEKTPVEQMADLDVLRRQIDTRIAEAREKAYADAEQAREGFAKRAAGSFADALRWNGENLIKAEAVEQEWKQFDHLTADDFQDGDPYSELDAYVLLVAQAEKALLSPVGGRSTDVFDMATTRCKAEARADFAGTGTSFGGYVRAMIQDYFKKAALA